MGRNMILTLLGVAALVLAPGPAFRVDVPGKIKQTQDSSGGIASEREANAGEVHGQRLGGVPVPSAEELKTRDLSRKKLPPGSVSPVWMSTERQDLEPEGWPPMLLEMDLRQRDRFQR